MRTPTLTAALLAGLALAACKDEPPVVEELGSFETDTGGLTPPIPVTVGEDAQSVFIGCGWDAQSGDLATAWEIKKPNGSYYYVNPDFHENADSDGNKPMRVGVHELYLPMLMPVSPQAEITPGDWELQVWVASGGQSRTVDCTKVERVADVPDTAIIDVELVFVGLDGVNAGNADGNGDVQDMLTALERIWTDAGLGLGDITYKNFSGDTAKFTVIDNDSSEPYDLYKTVPDSVGQKLVMFMVQEITSSDGAIIEGVAAGPPGAATLGGTAKSGMIVGADTLGDDPGRVAQVAAHEGAHFLGLFHTSEKDGGANDPLQDTPNCTASDDADGNELLVPDECDDGQNLMFWAPPSSSNNQLSSNQGWVLRRNPAAR